MLKLNETPVRTSRNFNINNIKIEDIEMPEVIEEFNNVDIIRESENIEISSEIKNTTLTYGLGDFLTELVNNKSNCMLKINIEENKDSKNYIDFKFDDENKDLFENIEIESKENSKSTIIIKYETRKFKVNNYNKI